MSGTTTHRRNGDGILLSADQTPGAYPSSWYAATANPHAEDAALDTDITADVCVVGGGYTGLSSALHLAERGMNVVLLEAHRVGWGASGRNGGQLGTGHNKDQFWLEKKLGRHDARMLWDIAEDAKTLVRDRITRHGIACDLTPGVIEVMYAPKYANKWRAGTAAPDWPSRDDMHALTDHIRETYEYDQYEVVGPDEIAAHVGSPRYCGGLLDHGADHLHPLNLALGLADAARAAGVRIFEHSVVAGLTHGSPARVEVGQHSVLADAVILGCNSYLDDLAPEVARRLMPINNFIAATEPLDAALADELIPNNVAVADSNFVINYFRMSADRRMLFGGGETYSYKFPTDVAALVRKPMADIFPQLRDIPIDYAWGGSLAITSSRLPHFAALAPNVWSASGYSGHGVALANMAGVILADAVAGTMERFDVMARLPNMAVPGGARFRHPLLALAMSWHVLRDRLGI